MVHAELLAQDLAQVRLHVTVVEQVDVGLPPAQKIPEPVGGRIRRHLSRDAFVQQRVEGSDLVAAQRVRNHQVTLQIEQVALLFGHLLPSPRAAWRSGSTAST